MRRGTVVFCGPQWCATTLPSKPKTERMHREMSDLVKLEIFTDYV
jgi:hypothetical protein